MRIVAVLMALFAGTAAFGAEENVSVPWSELKALYRESVERELAKEAVPVAKVPFVYSMDEARYTLDVDADGARGEAVLSGTVVSGEPEAIPLLGGEAVITEVREVSGGRVLCASGGRMLFLPESGGGAFRLTAGFLVRPQEENRARTVSWGIPYALQNALALELSPECRLLGAPGVADADGTYYFPAGTELSVKYLGPEGLAAAAAIEVDLLSHIRVRDNRIVVGVTLRPVRAVTGPLTLQVSENAVCASSSLKASQIKKLGADRYELTLPADDAASVSLELVLDGRPADGAISFALPAIEGNTGQQGRFTVQEPDDKEIAVAANGLLASIPVERLGPAWAEEVQGVSTYMTVPDGEPVTLTVQQFRAVAAPSTVLECQHFFSAFEENGNVLSVLILDVPPDVGPRLTLKAVPESEVWSLTVNEAKKSLYASEGGDWIVPLAAGQTSHVELAFLQKGPKLGLHGRIEMTVPESGLPSREMRIGVALPARVELLSVEGPVSPADGKAWKRPSALTGKPYSFSRSFYKGDGMKLEMAYKEPINPMP